MDLATFVNSAEEVYKGCLYQYNMLEPNTPKAKGHDHEGMRRALTAMELFLAAAREIYSASSEQPQLLDERLSIALHEWFNSAVTKYEQHLSAYQNGAKLEGLLTKAGFEGLL